MARRRRSSGVVRVSVPDEFYTPLRIRTAMQLIEDNRRFHPAGVLRAPRSFFMRPNLVVAVPGARPGHRRSKAALPSRIGFEVPEKVIRCVRRKQRREVIHAKRLQRKGAVGSKHFNLWSDIKC